jgi:hypothetical protein
MSDDPCPVTGTQTVEEARRGPRAVQEAARPGPRAAAPSDAGIAYGQAAVAAARLAAPVRASAPAAVPHRP